MPTLVLNQLVGGTRVSDERTGEETGIVRYIAYQEENGTKVTGSPFTPQVLKTNQSYIDTIKAQPAPAGTSYQRYDAQQYGSSLYDLEVTVYFSKNGRYGGPTTGPDLTGDTAVQVSSATENRAFTIPVQAEQSIVVPGATSPQTVRTLRGLTDTTPITTFTILAPLNEFNTGIVRLINEKVNQLHYIAPNDGGIPQLYRFKGAKSVRRENDIWVARYEWEFDIGSPARLWDGDDAPRVFGRIGDPDSPPVPQVGPVNYNNGVGWWRPPYCQIGAGSESFEYTPPFFTQPVTITQPAPVVFIDGLTDDPNGYIGLPGL